MCFHSLASASEGALQNGGSAWGGAAAALRFLWIPLAKKGYILIWLLIAGAIVPNTVPGTLPC